MFRDFTKSSITTAWLVTLAVVLGIVSGTTSIVALCSIAAIGVAPAVILNVLARTPQRTMAEIIRAVDEGRST